VKLGDVFEEAVSFKVEEDARHLRHTARSWSTSGRSRRSPKTSRPSSQAEHRHSSPYSGWT
jgi:hypothetical protein